MQIRIATESDIPAILPLYAQMEPEGDDVLTLEEAVRIFRTIESYPSYHIYVAVEGEEIVGTFALAVMDNLAGLGEKSGVVEDVVVNTAHRGKGIGKAMMQYALERCKEHDCYKMSLSSNVKRESAHRFYESLGFQKHGYSFLITMDE